MTGGGPEPGARCACGYCMPCQQRGAFTLPVGVGAVMPTLLSSTFTQCEKCTWWHAVGGACITPPSRLSDAEVERIADAVAKKLSGAGP